MAQKGRKVYRSKSRRRSSGRVGKKIIFVLFILCIIALAYVATGWILSMINAPDTGETTSSQTSSALEDGTVSGGEEEGAVFLTFLNDAPGDGRPYARQRVQLVRPGLVDRDRPLRQRGRRQGHGCPGRPRKHAGGRGRHEMRRPKPQRQRRHKARRTPQRRAPHGLTRLPCAPSGPPWCPPGCSPWP